MEKNVLVIGSTCVDVIIRVDHLPHTEENLHPDGQQFAIGGCAYNAANILGRGGAPTTFVTPVGLQGVFGGFVQKQLETLPFAQPVYLPDAASCPKKGAARFMCFARFFRFTIGRGILRERRQRCRCLMKTERICTAISPPRRIL